MQLAKVEDSNRFHVGRILEQAKSVVEQLPVTNLCARLINHLRVRASCRRIRIELEELQIGTQTNEQTSENKGANQSQAQSRLEAID